MILFELDELGDEYPTRISDFWLQRIVIIKSEWISLDPLLIDVVKDFADQGKVMFLPRNKCERIVQERPTSEWPRGAPPSRLEITLRGEGEGTELSLVQASVPAEQVEDYAQGWHDRYRTPLSAFLKKDHK